MITLEDLARALPPGSGAIGLLSSDEFTAEVRPFDQALLRAARGKTVGVIYCADHRAQPHSARLAAEHFDALGARAFELDMHAAGDLPDFDLAYLAGGSPKVLLACLRDSVRWEEVLQRWRGGAGLAGSSAGAMALCEHCLVPTEGASVPTEWTKGLGPVSGTGLAVHAATRPHEWLLQVAAGAPVPVLAIDDRTGLILRAGRVPEAAGPGTFRFVIV